jgi:NADPH:quinone reductase-like Zn-dependent oxidoreductase
MKAIQLTAYGNPAQNLIMVEASEPHTPSAGEALVRMEYAPVAYSDLLSRETRCPGRTAAIRETVHRGLVRLN